MKINYIVPFFIASLFLASCSALKKDPLKEVVHVKSGIIQEVIQNPEHEVQIIYTQIKRGKHGKITFKDYKYQVNNNNYHYPASTVKFPIAVMALEKLSSIPDASINSEFSIGDNPKKWKFSEEISKLFAVSENEASNHLFEFIGYDYLNDGMHKKGLYPFRITHRLSTPNSSSLTIQPITLYKDNQTTSIFPSTISKKFEPLTLNNVKKGIGYLNDETNTIINSSFDFSMKNDYPVETLHNTLKRIIFPETFKENERFHLSEKFREFVLFSMQNLPKNAGYDPKEYYDGYCKFLMFGDTKENIPDHIKIYNKVGDAYGTLTDCAYIVDTKNNLEFMVTATLLVNKNKIFNDGVYEYETVGFPFLAELGRQLYEKTKNK
ncbi:serine hydrolase [Flavobacterium sp. TSSA_36]|uniref:serine hydrolase n=1 Tax=Flavobacterium sp. TSSA_36 TaxID=3447669 RepID=UPI003F3034B2